MTFLLTPEDRCNDLELRQYTTYNLLLLAEESMTLQSLIELALRDVRKDLVLSFISGAIRYSEKEKEGIIFLFLLH